MPVARDMRNPGARMHEYSPSLLHLYSCTFASNCLALQLEWPLCTQLYNVMVAENHMEKPTSCV